MIRRVLIVLAICGGVASAEPDPPPTRTEYPDIHLRGGAEPARMSDGSHLSLPPLVIPAEPRPIDRRPFYVGAALLAAAIIAYWNRRTRAAHDDDDRDTRADGRDRVRRVRAATREPEPESDDDADDLHAAAADSPTTTAPETAKPTPEAPDER